MYTCIKKNHFLPDFTGVMVGDVNSFGGNQTSSFRRKGGLKEAVDLNALIFAILGGEATPVNLSQRHGGTDCAWKLQFPAYPGGGPGGRADGSAGDHVTSAWRCLQTWICERVRT